MAKQDMTRTDPLGKQQKRAVLLRQRFDAAEQMRKHLHVVEGTTLFFFRAPSLELAIGATVLLEFCLETSDQTRLLRGSVLARAEELGWWLQFPSTRFARDIEAQGLVSRRGRRVGTDRLVRLRRGRNEYLGMMLDVSQGGARIGGGLPPGLATGEEMDIVLAAPERGEPPELGRAKVVWVDEGEAGIAFDRSSPTTRVAVTKFYQSAEAPWKQAIEVRHLPDCCGSAGVREPPVPRLRVDKGVEKLDITKLF
jgi:hypothetical protein